MPSDAEGVAIARDRIAAEKVAPTGFLDLGRLGLTRVPDEFFSLDHLWGLNWGSRWYDREGKLHFAASSFGPNDHEALFPFLHRFPALEMLSIAETWVTHLSPLAELTTLHSLNCYHTSVSDLAPLAGLIALQSFDCSFTLASDLKPLAGLAALQSLKCSRTQVSQLEPLASLTTLQSLDCSYTQVSELKPLAALTALQSLNCSYTQVSELKPLAALTALQSLNCCKTQVSELKPLATLTALQSLNCSYTLVSELKPLAALTALQSLNFYSTQVSELKPLAALTALQSLDCSFTHVSELKPLAALTALQSLDCRYTQVSDVKPLATLTALQSLNCSDTQVSDLKPLAALTALQSLDCSDTQVSDLKPLAALTALRWLDCSSTQVCDLPRALVSLNSLQFLYLFNTRITDIPAEVLSPDVHTSCLKSLRAHLADLEAGECRLTDVKALVLGNGRIGKTQICRRLRGEDFDPDSDSTHGITVTSATLTIPQQAGEEARLHLWDFGGQDLYHGTHALFMRTRSLFMLVWTPQSENAREHEYGGMTFRNQRLAYWVEYVKHLSGHDSPVLIVQNQCDQPGDEARHSPVEDQALRPFGFHKELPYSALKDRNRVALNDALQQAVLWQWDTMGQAKIGKGRLDVKRKLESLRDEDAALPPEKRKYRTLTQEFFHHLCTEAGGVSDPGLLLDYLHHAGIVFYGKDLFDNSIVLDQAWALDAVYAVFNREKSYRQLLDAKGRFKRSHLEALVWGHYSVAEQELFLSFMTACGICFVHRKEDEKLGLETEYIAPDLLPDREQVAVEIEAIWRDEEPREELVFELPFLHPGVMRGILSRIGKAAGISAIYWKFGVCLYETTTHSRALITERPDESPTTWSGQITVSARGGQASELLHRLQDWIEREINQASCRDWKILTPSVEPRSPRTKGVDRRPGSKPERELIAPESPLKFGQPPSDTITYCVSYAWNDESKTIVDKMCAEAESRQIKILRDATGLGLGENITKFMQKLGEGKRVFVILSDKYLKSPFCMYELLEVWRNSKMDPEELRRRIHVFRLPDAKISTPLERLDCAIYWDEQFTQLDQRIKQHSAVLLGKTDLEQYKLMKDFAHRVGDILALVADTLQPTDFDEFVAHGFGDRPL